MKPLTLEKAFNIAFYEKDSFQNFLSFNPSQEIKFSHFDGREVIEPNTKLKEYHKFINEFILSYLKVNENVVFSYRKGSSTYDAIKIHADSKVFFNTDIKDFFASISGEFIKKIIVNNIDNIPITDLRDYIEVLSNYLIIEDSLPVGFATSPSLSNACLYEFDNTLEQLCISLGFKYSRYADDIIVSSPSDEAFNDVPVIIRNMLRDFNGGVFKINEQKTKLVRKGNKIKLLGMVILPSGKISVDIRVKKRVEHLIHFYVTDKSKFIKAVKSDPKIKKTDVLSDREIEEKGVGVISGLLNHINTIDKSYLNKLRKKYGNTVVDMVFYKSAN
ncbi:reverse transcriptase domain-containing protein [Kosakonia cowanii]